MSTPPPPSLPSRLLPRLKAVGGLLLRGAGRLALYPLRRPLRFLGVSGLLAVIALGVGLAASHFWLRHHREFARADLQRYHNMEAMRHLEICLRFQSRDPDTLLMAARAARRLGLPETADHWLNRYESLYGIEDDRFTLERLLLRVERGEVESLITYFDARIKEDHPDAGLILEALTTYFLRSFRLKDAHYALSMWLRREPDNPQALLFQARLFDMQQNVEGALSTFRRVVELDPEMDRARLLLTEIQLRLGLAEEALPHLQYLRSRQPDNLEVEVRLARCHLLLGQPGNREEAIRILDGILAREPNYPAALAERGKLARQTGDSDQAEALLRRAVQQDPDDTATRYQLYLCLIEAGRTAEAKEEQARLKQKEEDQKKMQQIIGVEMQQSPHNPDLHFEVASIAFRAGLTSESVRWLQQTLKEDPHYVPAHRALADYYQGIGNTAQAAYHREQARQGAAQAPARRTGDSPGR